MDATAILHDLTFAGGLPRDALDAATAQRAEMTPLFLAEIDSWLAAGPGAPTEPSPLFLIFHLLGSWGETAAYRPLARLLRCPAARLGALLDDALTETAHRVMASVFDGDPEPLHDIILDPRADEYVRARMCNTLAMLVHWGDLDRAGTARFLQAAFGALQPRAECFVWDGWQDAIAMLGLSEMKAQVRTAYQRGFIGEKWSDFGEFENDLAYWLARPAGVLEAPGELYTPFGDVVSEMEGWEFARNPDPDDDGLSFAELGALFQLDSTPAPPAPFADPYRGVGRNDPCPCGSTKKFKKCCGR